MKSNTKLIMETWRRFLKEGTEGIGPDGMVRDEDEDFDASKLPPVEDNDLSGDLEMTDSMNIEDPFDRETQGPDDYIPDEMIIDEILEYLRNHPSTSDEDLAEMFGAYDEDIQAARLRQEVPSTTPQVDDMYDMDDM